MSSIVMKNTASNTQASEEVVGRPDDLIQIKLFGLHDVAAQAWRKDLDRALGLIVRPFTLREISEPNTIASYGVKALPALMVNDTLVFQGDAPGAEAMLRAIQDADLYRSKLYRLQRMTIPVDFSDHSANALRYGHALAEVCKTSDLEIVHVVDQVFKEAVGSDGFYAKYRQSIEQELEEFIKTQLGDIPAPSMMPGETNTPTQKVSPIVDYGYPDIALIKRSTLSDMLVMSTTGKGALAAGLLGSVSATVLKKAHCPVLFVPPHTSFNGFKRILYASNFDSLQLGCIRQVSSFAAKMGGELFFAHVGTPDFDPSDLEAKLFEVDYSFAAPERAFHYRQIYGDNIAETLFEYAFEQAIDLMVFVTHERPFWEQVIHSSVSLYALKNTEWPLLVLHSDDDVI